MHYILSIFGFDSDDVMFCGPVSAVNLAPALPDSETNMHVISVACVSSESSRFQFEHLQVELEDISVLINPVTLSRIKASIQCTYLQWS